MKKRHDVHRQVRAWYFELQAVRCVVRLVDQPEEPDVLVEPIGLKSPLVLVQETEHRLREIRRSWGDWDRPGP
jgi:hypothetical protein